MGTPANVPAKNTQCLYNPLAFNEWAARVGADLYRQAAGMKANKHFCRLTGITNALAPKKSFSDHRDSYGGKIPDVANWHTYMTCRAQYVRDLVLWFKPKGMAPAEAKAAKETLEAQLCAGSSDV